VSIASRGYFMSRRQDRNVERVRVQADVEKTETQDLRPEHERSATEDAKQREQADVEEARKG
jgi:hypothetical protein